MQRPLTAIVLGLMLGIPCAAWTLVNAFGQGKPSPVQHHPAPLAGKVEVRESAKLTRFKEPIKTAPRIHPPDIDKFRWHWHPHFGWVSLPIGTAQFVELGETFALPAQVRVYEATPATNVLSCPHCGQPLTISLR